MSHQRLNFIFLISVTLLYLIEVSLGAAVGEKREMPAQQPQYGGGVPYTPYDSYSAQPSASSPAYAAPAAPQYGPSPYSNPGFSVQTGFEGFLVPNSWYGLLPWGIEGVIIVIVGIIVFIVISVVILGLLAWLTGFGDYAIVKESARNLIPNLHINFEALTDITNAVLDALDKYEEIQAKKSN